MKVALFNFFVSVVFYVTYETRETFFSTTFPTTEKRIENATRSGAFLTNFKVFANVVKNGLEFSIYLLNQNKNREKTEK